MRILKAMQRGHARILGIGLIAAFAAGCSSDTARFGADPFTNPFSSSPKNEITNTAPAQQAQQPVAQIESRPLDAPVVAANPPRTLPAAPAPAIVQQTPQPVQSTGSAQREGNWRWDGGTAITVQRGETLEIIARRYQVPVAIILRANNLATATLVQPGQRLVIPSNGERSKPIAAVPARPAAIHTVNQGDTLLSLSRRYKIGAAELARANKITVTTQLKLGQKLTIPGTARAATQPAQPRRAETEATPVPQQEKVAAVKPVEQIEARPALTGTPQFRWPVKGRVISGFGQKPNGQQNDGINLSVPEGTPIKASEDGVVAYSGNELKGYGNLVLIRHAAGWVTAYAHTSELLVKRGEAVKRGQVIARAGQTGGVVAPQLHFEIRKGSTPVDPAQHLSSL